ncbi:hypothetical protein [Nostoc sp.]|uniref:hypothetical protein n=1 Tax=Nostoc sp. TaxID=1180 RepID=UPI002FF82C5B
MTLAMIREFQFPADKRFRVKLTPMGMFPTGVPHINENSYIVGSVEELASKSS